MSKDDEFVWSPPDYTWEDWWDDNNQDEDNNSQNEFAASDDDVDNDSWVEKLRGVFKI